MADKLILSAGFMCDMSYTKEGADGEAFIHNVNGKWEFDPKLYWAWLQPLANAGINLHRIALYCVGSDAPRSKLFMPWHYLPGVDAWDLRVKNQSFFDILRMQAIEANKMNVRLMVCILNECEERTTARKLQSPFYHNINSVVGLYHEKALPYISILTGWILEALEGTVFAIELINEGHRRNSGSVQAVEVMLPKLLMAGVEPRWISLGADVIDGRFTNADKWLQRWPDELQPPKLENYDLFLNRLVRVYDKTHPNATHEVFYVTHSFGEKADEDFPAVHPYGRRTGYTKECWLDRNLASNRVCFSTDGTDHADDPGGRPSAQRMHDAMLYVMNSNPRFKLYPTIAGNPKLWFDYLPQRQKIPAVAEVVKQMSLAHKEFFGVWPENYGKIPPYQEGVVVRHRQGPVPEKPK